MFGYLRQRDVIITLTKYEFKLRYRGTVLGIGWSLLAPFLLAVVLYFVFRNVFRFVENFALYVLVGVFVFRFFSVATSVGMYSIISKANFVTKTNLSREILPLVTTLTYFFSSFIELLILIPIISIFGGEIGMYILLLPVIHIVYLIFVYGVNLYLSAITVYFRDLNQIWEVITNILFFASPIVYPIRVIPKEYVNIYMLNPLTRFIELYRDVMIYNTFSINDFVYVLISSLLVFTSGHIFFRRLQRKFGEVL
ncbi:ABC transporter permease [Archaeoglobus profundus]|uniref:ABC-2 type transporter n=1 Tax=Archaeoglobus profundus (strain DSM 5631 / JCM 9629 / NBRC 100127 / Av18) TaxID=572546 RepID=D2RDR3_ARCPA|nr:ABC transporter permease [Archaeoglobus profundus]ADB58257.1 ABC-2 type transporter [Archaeoglobus profundus DSM 5631]